MQELTHLSEAIVAVALEEVLGQSDLKRGFSILAFGKLGGRELNYSSTSISWGSWMNGSRGVANGA